MLLNKILKSTGLPYAPVRFLEPPKETYLIYLSEYRRYGADSKNFLTAADITFEIYSYDFPDEEAISLVGFILDDFALEYTRHETIYLNDERLYMTVFMFSYVEKDENITSDQERIRSWYESR